MLVSEEKIRENIMTIYSKYDFESLSISKEQCINDIVYLDSLVVNTKESYENIFEKALELYSLKKYKPLLQDIFQYRFKIVSMTYGIELNNVIDRYIDPYEDVEERMMFRMELYKYGWDVDQIERYIYKNILMKEFPLDMEDEDYSICEKVYHNILIRIDLYKIEKQRNKGRPSLPPTLKQYIKLKRNKVVKNNMNVIYENSKKYKFLRDSLTSNDIEFIKEKLGENKELMNKLNIILN